jgi:glucans biosynthesis protein
MTQQHTPPAQPARREFLIATSATLAALAAAAVAPSAYALQLRLASAEPFSYAALRERARALAAVPYQPPQHPPRAVLEQIDYDAHGKLRFKAEDALFANGPGCFPVTFFAMGRYFQTPVRMHVIDAQGAAQEIRYAPGYFDMPADSPAHNLGAHAGFAGFRIQESRLADQQHLDWHSNDWAAFLGASYFRAIGGLYQYGLSARGIAVNVAVNGQAEEFPAFTDFYFAPPADDSATMTVYALLDGPSISGAYRFHLERSHAVIMDVEAVLFLRRDIERLGLAPATSMYWYSETMRRRQTDWRPEIHDSDGLALWSGNGERIWRPLNNPAQATVSAFQDRSPHGFGLLQRDRDFDHYLDGVHYERRPDLWVEPLGDWGAGSVQLVELPTDDETHDNIVAMWVPAGKASAGSVLDLRYRLHWTDDEPFPAPLARCVATRTGQGGEPGQERSAGSTKFVVEFLGGNLATLPFGVIPQAVVTAAHGTLGPASVEPVPDGVAGHWRVRFDFTAESAEPVELRLYLRLEDSALSETWLYQFHPASQQPS